MDKEEQLNRHDFGSQDFDYPEDMFLLERLDSYPGDLPAFEPEVYTEPEQGQAVVFDAVKQRSLQQQIPVEALINRKSRRKSKAPYFVIAALLLIISAGAVFWDDIYTGGADKTSSVNSSGKEQINNDNSLSPSFNNTQPATEEFVTNDGMTESLNKEIDNNSASAEQKPLTDVPDNKGQKISEKAAIQGKAVKSEKPAKALNNDNNASDFSIQKQENVAFNPEEVKIPEKKSVPPQEQTINLTDNSKFKDSRKTASQVDEQSANFDVFSTVQPKSNINSVYTVQVYSTPFREDAEEWAGKLNKKDASDVFISEQKVRDKVWYRVRFGNFKTKEEARAAALKLGFAQSWVDRVR